MRASYLLANLFIVAKVFAHAGADDNSIDINVINPVDDHGNHTLIDDHGNHNSTTDDSGNHNSTTDDSGNHNSTTDDSGNHNSTTDDNGNHTTDDSTTVPTAFDQSGNISSGANTIKSSLFYVFLGAFVNMFL